MKILPFLAVLACILHPTIGWATTPYAIDLKLMSSQSYGAIDVHINYAAANGDFSGTGTSVSCVPNASLGVTMVANDQAPLSMLKAGLMRTTEIAGPVVLFTCGFDSNSGAPSASNFVITIYDWSSESTTTAPTVQISRIEPL